MTRRLLLLVASLALLAPDLPAAKAGVLSYVFEQESPSLGPGESLSLKVYLQETDPQLEPAYLLWGTGVIRAGVRVQTTGVVPSDPSRVLITGFTPDDTFMGTFVDPWVAATGSEATLWVDNGQFAVTGFPDENNTIRIPLGTLQLSANGVPGLNTTFVATDYDPDPTHGNTFPPSSFNSYQYGEALDNSIFDSPELSVAIVGPGPLTTSWNGGAVGDNRWKTAANWGNTATVCGAKLVFGPVGSGHPENDNNFDPGTQFTDITFAANAPSFDLTGNSIKLAGPVANQSSSPQTISLDIELVAGGGQFNDGGQVLTLDGSISGIGPLVKDGDGTLVLDNTNHYTLGTIVNSGTLEVHSAGALPAGHSLTIGAGGTVVLSSGLSAAGASTGGMPVVQGSSAAVPEPGTIALLATGLAGLLVVAWRQKK